MADTNLQHDAEPSVVNTDENFKAEPRFSWPHMYLGALGFAISLYAFRLHAIIKAGGESGCGFSETINCDKVLASQYGAFLGLPLGAYGMAYFVLLIVTAITTNPKTTRLQETAQRLVVASAGLVGAGVLMYISYGIIKAACPVCMSIHATIIASFAVALWQFLKVRRKEDLHSEEPRAGGRSLKSSG